MIPFGRFAITSSAGTPTAVDAESTTAKSPSAHRPNLAVAGRGSHPGTRAARLSPPPTSPSHQAASPSNTPAAARTSAGDSGRTSSAPTRVPNRSAATHPRPTRAAGASPAPARRQTARTARHQPAIRTGGPPGGPAEWLFRMAPSLPAGNSACGQRRAGRRSAARFGGRVGAARAQRVTRCPRVDRPARRSADGWRRPARWANSPVSAGRRFSLAATLRSGENHLTVL